jgi:hypothetical protein
MSKNDDSNRAPLPKEKTPSVLPENDGFVVSGIGEIGTHKFKRIDDDGKEVVLTVKTN